MQILDAGKTGCCKAIIHLGYVDVCTVVPISKDSKEGNDIGL